jgi:menaquinone-specific isochorismate synthase
MNTHNMPYSLFDIYNETRSTDEIVDWLTSQDEFASGITDVCNNAKISEKAHLLAVTIPFESLDPLAALEILGNPDGFQYYWEHPDEKLAIAAGNEVIQIRTNQRDRFHYVHRQIAEWNNRCVAYSTLTHSLSGLQFLGGFSFQDQPQSHLWKNFGTSTFIVPEWVLIRDGQLSLLTITTKVDANINASELTEKVRVTVTETIQQLRNLSSFSERNGHIPHACDTCFEVNDKPNAEFKWKATVQQAKNRINKGDFKKIVLAREVPIKLHRDPQATHMLNHLRNEYPTCYTFMMRMNKNAVFLGCTPEKLVSLRSSYMLTDGLAGTISRGKTATEDTILERKLLQSDKDLVEHGFVVEAIGERLKDITHNMQFPDQPGIRKYQNVQHLYTPITASINKDVSPLYIIEKLHPTPAVGGHPRELAIEHIQGLEQFDRGWYAGPVGWINTHGRGEFCVAIRSGIISEGQARFFAGCGIVADSDPQSEWDETNLKLIPMLSALRYG